MRKQKKNCKKKRRYKTSQLAWEAAAFYFILYGGDKLYNVYPCHERKELHYHLTTKGVYGDGSHIDPRFRELFKTIGNPEPKLSFWHKLRRFLGC